MSGMSVEQAWLLKLSEACGNVSAFALNSMLFGIGSTVNAEVTETNRELLHQSLDEIQVAVKILNDKFELGYTPDHEYQDILIDDNNHAFDVARERDYIE